MLVVRLSRGVVRGVSSGVHKDVLRVTCLLSEVSGKGALPKVSSVVETVVLVEVMRDVGHAQENEK